MCGITGLWQTSGMAPHAAVVTHMANQLRHRGPDDGGVWIDGEGAIALAQRRLSILDLSPAGHQPMHSPCGRYVLVFNGEIYNHATIRRELEAVAGHWDWRGHADTETLLAALRYWGVAETLPRLVGMFAFALWDRAERQLSLARDRIGEKPLYYGWQGSTFLFGSELKALRAHPDFVGEIDRDALTLLLRHNAIGAPHSIYRDIRKLPPGTWLTLPTGAVPRIWPVPQIYWSLTEVARRGLADPFAGSPAEAVEALDQALREAIELQRLADVPVGAFLSGGIDSSTVVALMQAQSSRPVRTFSIGFHETAYDEAPHAKAVARHLGTDHTELYVTPQQALDVIPCLPAIWDEPFSSSSQVPTYLVAHLARQSVTVALSGDGGDELFGGYLRYGRTRQLWRRLRVRVETAITEPSPPQIRT